MRNRYQNRRRSRGASSLDGAAPPSGKSGGKTASSATSSTETNPPVPLSPELQRAQNNYLRTAPRHPDALGHLIAHLVEKESTIVARMQQLCEAHMSQPGFTLHDLVDAAQPLDIKNKSTKLFLAMSALEIQTRKTQLTSRDPLERVSYNANQELPPPTEEEKRLSKELQEMRAKTSQAPPPSENSTAASPALPPQPPVSEKSAN